MLLRNHRTFTGKAGLHNHDLYFRGCHVFSTHFEHVFITVTEVQVPRLINADDVAGVEPTVVVKRLLVCFEISVVLFEQRHPPNAADVKYAALARLCQPSFFVTNFNVVFGCHSPHAAVRARMITVGNNSLGQGLCHAPPAQYRYLEMLRQRFSLCTQTPDPIRVIRHGLIQNSLGRKGDNG